MQNQFEINEKEIEKEIEEEKLKSKKYRVFGNESYIPIKLKDLKKLKKSKSIIQTPFKTKKPSNEINLIFEMLFDEILLIILSYLSPGEIIMFSLTCKQAQYICSDYFLWKQISIKFQDYFSWNSFYFDYYYHSYPNFQLKAIQFKIQEKNQNNPKQKQIKELSKTNEKIKNYFDNSNSTIIKAGTYSYKANFISIKSERIIYIQNLENPKQEIEKRGKMIFKEFRKAKQQNILNEKYAKKYHNPNIRSYSSFESIFMGAVVILNAIILVSTLIILNYYIDSKKSISFPKLFLLTEINLIITIFWIIYSKSTFYSFQEYYNYLSISTSGLIFMILISLKISKNFHFLSWLIVLLPLMILFIYFIYQMIELPKRYLSDRLNTIFFNFIFGYSIFVLLFTGLKLDGLIEIKYFNLIYLFITIFTILAIKTKDQIPNINEFSYFLVLTIGFLIILSFLFLYGDGFIKKLWIAFIPIYLLLIFGFFSLLLLFFYILSMIN